MSLLDEAKSIFRAYSINPRKSLGQNFCIDQELLDRMITYSKLSKEDTVLEIGAGLGFLTRRLSAVAKHVIAVEVDGRLLEVLREHLGGVKGLSIIEGNVLTVKLPKFNKVIANPPYSISSRLILFLLTTGFESAVLTLQKEFTEKLIAEVGTKEYGSITVFTDYTAHVSLLEELSRETFYPQPKVESTVVLLEACKPKFNLVDKDLFFELVTFLFTQRNRKMRKPLESFLGRKLGISKVEARLIVESLPFIEMRVYKMKSEDFGMLSNKIHRLIESKRIVLKDRVFYIFPGVYEPSEDTFLISEHLEVKKEENVLDIGTGCGALGIMAAQKAKSVVVLDINPNAVQCARFNAKLNHVLGKVDFVRSDLFTGFQSNSKFDIIIFNPPYLPGEERIKLGKWIERAWCGGSDGRAVIDRFLKEVSKHVENRGRVVIVQSSISNPEKSLRMFREMGFQTDVIAEEALFFEKIKVIRAKKLK